MRVSSILSAVAGAIVALGVSTAAYADVAVPTPGTSKKVDESTKRGVLNVAVLAEAPWLAEITTGSGPQYFGSAWAITEEIARRLGVKIAVTPVSHETKIPILAT